MICTWCFSEERLKTRRYYSDLTCLIMDKENKTKEEVI